MMNNPRRHQAVDAASTPVRSPRVLLLLILVVATVVVVVHWPVLSAAATTFDDDQYWGNNELVQHPSWASAARFFQEVLKPSTVGGYYQPLTMVSLMLDRALATGPEDLQPAHRTNLILHALVTILILLLLFQLFGNVWVAALVAVLFGVHPMAVEPVAWLGERKTLLATFFSLVSLVSYVSYVRRSSAMAYGAALGAFVLALLSKPTSTPLPVLILLLDCWPLRRLSVRTILEKVPFFAVACVSAIITVVSQARSAAIELPHGQSQFHFALTLCHDPIVCLWTMIWPVNLTLWQPHPDPFDLTQPSLRAGVIGTLILLPVLLVSLRWTRALCIGWLFFLVAMSPTLGVIGFTINMASSKYAYLPAVGLLIVLTAALAAAEQRWHRTGASKVRVAILAGLLAAVAVAGWRTRVELAYWRTTECLYRHMLSFAPNAILLRNSLGADLVHQGRLTEAIEQFRAAAVLPPSWGIVEVHMNWGTALQLQGQLDEAIEHYTAAVAIDPDSAPAHRQLGQALLARQRWADAETHLNDALRLRPDLTPLYVDLGVALARQSKYEQARSCLENALQGNPRSTEALGNLALVLVKAGRVEEGIQRYQEALQSSPDRFEIRVNLADALRRQGRLDDAAAEFRAAINLRPDFAYCYSQLGQILISQGRLDGAIDVYEAGLRAAPDDAELRAALGAARSSQTAGGGTSRPTPGN